MMEDRRKRIEEDVHHDHHEFIKILIEREKNAIAFKKSVIEKTTASLIWTFIVFCATAIMSYLKGIIK